MTTLTTTLRETRVGYVLEIVGDLDFHTAEQFREALQAIDPRPGQLLVLDLAGLSFCDSSGITAFVVARNHALSAQARIALAAVPANTARVLRIVGLDQVFAIHPDAASATAASPSAADQLDSSAASG